MRKDNKRPMECRIENGNLICDEINDKGFGPDICNDTVDEAQNNRSVRKGSSPDGEVTVV